MTRRHWLFLTSAASAGLFAKAWARPARGGQWTGKFPNLKGYQGKVAIVGAGAAGLYAAHVLQQQGVGFSLFEASDKVGGRIRTLDDFADFPIELGAEEVHGTKNNLWWETIKTHAQPAKDAGEDYVYFDGRLRKGTYMEERPGYQKLMVTLEEAYRYQGPYQSVAEYLRSTGLPKDYFPLAEALIGNEYGTDLQSMDAKAWAEAEKAWATGENNLLLKGPSHLALLEKAWGRAWRENLYLNTPILNINWEGDKISLETARGESHEADKCLVTVPLPILQQGVIDFSPALPNGHQKALRTLKMGKGLKLVLRFAQAFWPHDMASLYPPAPVPEIWVTSAGRSQNNHVLTAFVNGQAYEAIHQNPLEAVLKALDTCFDGAASEHLTASHLQDWAQEKWVGGCYSYPSKGSAQARAELAKPLSDKLYFAGEHCNTRGHFATVHGAMESARDALTKLAEGI